jgi:lytic murein transglycosylase
MLPTQHPNRIWAKGTQVIFRIRAGTPGSSARIAAARALVLAALSGAMVSLAALLQAPGAGAQAEDAFRRFVEGLWPEADGRGVSRATFDAAFRRVRPDLGIPDLVLPGKPDRETKGQAEFTRTPAEYLNLTQLARLSAQGKSLLTKHRDTLEAIERRLGVERHVVLAIWGRETGFGAHRPTHYAIQVLATQAYLGRRKELFRNELMHALKMLEDGVLTRETMKSSWAGAMGLTQFMPSEYYTLAYDLDGDGRSDIWQSIPDALASTANQLRNRGWVPGHTWGYEVRLPAGITCRMEGPPHARTIREWIRLGVVRTRSRPFPDRVLGAQAFVLTVGGARGPAFLALENFMVIKRYNMSDLYALFVGDLADRIAGGGGFDVPWKGVVQLPARGIEEIQRRLLARGYPISKIDGKAGMNTRALIGAYQHDNRLEVDCWPSQAVLAHLRRNGATSGAAPAPPKGSLGAR